MIEVIQGNEAVLPETVDMTFLNGSTKAIAVTWDVTDLDTTVVGTYTVHGSVEDDPDVDVTVVVNVVADYIVSVADSYASVAIGEKDVMSVLPSTVSATLPLISSASALKK